MRGKAIALAICVVVLAVAFSGCLDWFKGGLKKALEKVEFDAEVSEVNNTTNVISWHIWWKWGKSAEIDGFTWEIIDENNITVWTGKAVVSTVELTPPTATGINYYDEEADGLLDAGDEFSVKAPGDGYYKVKATYEDQVAWESALKSYG